MQFRTIKLGSHGALVETWQARLLVDGAPLTPDGFYGPATLAATKTWQLAHGLSPDGVVGQMTWAAAGFATHDASLDPGVVVDLSHHNWVFDFDALVRATTMQIFKVSQGISSIDPAFLGTWDEKYQRTPASNIDGLRAAGATRLGGYHYLNECDGREQAQHFLDALSHRDRSGIVPMLDAEWAPDGEPHAKTAQRALDWTETVEQALGRRVLVYTGSFFLHVFRDSAAGSALATRPLMIARYPGDPGPGPVDPWPEYTLHQHTAHGSLPGIANHVDLSRSVALDVLDARVGAVR